jgi:phi13 family phage major tail protein
MATIGLDKLYYATITDAAETGYETYGTPALLAKAISAKLSVEIAEGMLYADDGVAHALKEFKSGTITLGVEDIGQEMAAALTGAVIDDNGVLVSASGDSAPAVAIGFRAKKANGKYRYVWLYRAVFGIPDEDYETKGDSIAFKTGEIVGTVVRRHEPDDEGRYPWRSLVDEDGTGVLAATITSWFTAVYEPVYPV